MKPLLDKIESIAKHSDLFKAFLVTFFIIFVVVIAIGWVTLGIFLHKNAHPFLVGLWLFLNLVGIVYFIIKVSD